MRRTLTVAALLTATAAGFACSSDATTTDARPERTTPDTRSTPTEWRPPSSVTTSSEPSPATTDPPSSTSVATTSSAPRVQQRLRGLVVVLDPGHNGGNAGAPRIINAPVDAGGFTKACNTTGTAGAGGYTESEFNWAAALAVRSALQAEGARVVLTRESDDGVGPCIDVRGGTAAKVGGHVLISIHADGSTNASHRGFHIIHPSPRRGYTDATAPRSAILAALLRDRLVDNGWTPSNYLGDDGLDQRDDLGTLNLSAAPAIMLEAGNMRSGADLDWLRSDASKLSLAGAVVEALAALEGQP